MLNQKEQKVFDYIKKYIEEYAYPPSVREICKGLDIKSTSTVHSYLKKLKEKGYIQKQSLKTRALKIAKEGEEKEAEKTLLDANIVSVPLVQNIYGESFLEDANTRIDIPRWMLKKVDCEDIFLYKVKDEAMFSAGIFSGDYVICEKSKDAKYGDMVVTNIAEKTTIRTYYPEKNGFVRLQPENSDLEEIVLQNPNISGKVVGVLRV